jgi:hypothetical protein
MSYSLSSNFVPVEWLLAEAKYQVNIYKDVKKRSGQPKIWTKSTSSRTIAQPNIISFRLNNFWLSYGHWTCIFCSNLKLSALFFDVVWYIDLIFGLWLYLDSQIPNIKSIYQRTSRKSLDNLKFEQKYKFKGHNSAKYHSTGTKFELKLRILFRLNDFWLSYGHWTYIFCSNFKLSVLFFDVL